MKSGYYVATDATYSQPPEFSEEHVRQIRSSPQESRHRRTEGEIYDEQPETFYDDTWGLPQGNGRSSKKKNTEEYSLFC